MYYTHTLIPIGMSLHISSKHTKITFRMVQTLINLDFFLNIVRQLLTFCLCDQLYSYYLDVFNFTTNHGHFNNKTLTQRTQLINMTSVLTNWNDLHFFLLRRKKIPIRRTQKEIHLGVGTWALLWSPNTTIRK